VNNRRIYKISTALVVCITSFLFAHCAVADGKIVHGTFILNGAVSPASVIQHIVDKVPYGACAHKGGVNPHSNVPICFCKMGIVLDDDWVEKIAAAKPAAKFAKPPIHLCGQFSVILSELTSSQWFYLSSSGLSPPSL
jgi:hypothetical protein